MATIPADSKARVLKAMLVLCLVYGAAMIALAAFLASQHAWTQVAVFTSSAVAPITVSASLYASAKRGQLTAPSPRHKRLLLIALGGAVFLGAGLVGALLLVK